MNNEDLEPVLMAEMGYGITEMVDSLEDSYRKSCEHNETTDKDLGYFRRYVWNLISLQEMRLRQIEERLK